MKRTVILSALVLLFALAAIPAFCSDSTSLLVALETPRTEVGSFAPASQERAFARQAESILSAASIPLEEVIPLPYLGLAIVRTSAPSGEALESLRQTPGVLQADLPGKNYLFAAPQPRAYTPTEPRYDEQWYLPAIGCPTAWDTTLGDSTMVAAVLDTGVDYGHPDLAASMWINPGEIPNNGIDDDGNGIIDDYYGIAAFNNGGVLTGDPNDNLPGGGHGTHVAGSIAAPINGVGILGVAPNVKIMGVRVFTYDPAEGTLSAFDTDIARGLNYILAMKNRGVNVRALNLSLGTCPGASPSNTMLQAYRAVSDGGMLIFFAAGNDSNNNDANLVYPANYNVPLKVTVGATDTDGTSRADWGGTSNCGYPSGSNYGATTVDIFAPGTSILSTVPTFVDPSGYASWDGTSMATPVTLGAALLTWSVNPALSGAQVRTLLLNNGTPSAALAGLCVTGRVVNAAASVAAAATQPTPTTAPTTAPTRIPTVAPGPSSGGGGGCSLGFASLAGVLFILPLLLMRKSSR